MSKQALVLGKRETTHAPYEQQYGKLVCYSGGCVVHVCAAVATCHVAGMQADRAQLICTLLGLVIVVQGHIRAVIAYMQQYP